MEKKLPSFLSSTSIKEINGWLSQFEKIDISGIVEREDDCRLMVAAELLYKSGVHFEIGVSERSDITHKLYIDFGNGNVIISGRNFSISKKDINSLASETKKFQPKGDHFLKLTTGKSPKDFSLLSNKAFIPRHQKIRGVLTDDTGNPLVVFRGEHGEGEGIGMQSRLPSLSFGSCNAANIYSCQPNNRDDVVTAAKIYPCYLKIKKPLDINKDPFLDFSVVEKIIGYDESKRLFLKHGDHVENTGAFLDICEEHNVESLEELIEINENSIKQLYLSTWVALDDPEFVDLLKSKGYDGAIHYGAGETGLELEYRIFDESQIVYALSEPALNQLEPEAEFEMEI